MPPSGSNTALTGLSCVATAVLWCSNVVRCSVHRSLYSYLLDRDKDREFLRVLSLERDRYLRFSLDGDLVEQKKIIIIIMIINY